MGLTDRQRFTIKNPSSAWHVVVCVFAFFALFGYEVSRNVPAHGLISGTLWAFLASLIIGVLAFIPVWCAATVIYALALAMHEFFMGSHHPSHREGSEVQD